MAPELQSMQEVVVRHGRSMMASRTAGCSGGSSTVENAKQSSRGPDIAVLSIEKNLNRYSGHPRYFDIASDTAVWEASIAMSPAIISGKSV